VKGCFTAHDPLKADERNGLDSMLCALRIFFAVLSLLSLEGDKSDEANWTECSEFSAGAVACRLKLFMKSDTTRKHKPMNVSLARNSRSLSVLHSDRG
jgi:hypothetical protein